MAAQRMNLARKEIFIPAVKPDETVVLKVAAYCRVSTDSDDQLNSFAAQHTHYKEVIRNHEQWELVEIYADEGITGTSAQKRGDFQRMLSDCRKGKIDRILVKSISRFARNTKECLETLRDLQGRGISVYFEEHNLDTRMVASEMLTTILASCAQKESESISQNMQWRVQHRMEMGIFNTCRPAIGFRLKPGGLGIQEAEAAVIERIFAEYLQGMNSREIADRLNAKQMLDRSWNRKLVDYILTNERYAGNALLQKKYRTDTFPWLKKRNRGERPMYYVQNSNPAIVAQDVFDQATALRQSRKREYETKQARFFAKRIACGCCGSLLRSKKVNGNWY